MIENWLNRFRQKDRRALSRLITLASRGEHLETIRSALAPADKRAIERTAQVVAFTGHGGVGKSSLIGKSIELLQQDKRVAVLACDPQSPLTSGALLGDRIRMSRQQMNADVYIRSLAVPGGQQAIAANLDVSVRLLEAFGFDVILIETVGAGQSDTAVRQVADVVALLLQPESGDELQWEKAGLLEVADIVVIHKSDLPGSERTESQVRELLNLPGCREVPVLSVSSARNRGLQELWEAIESVPKRSTIDNSAKGV